MNCYIGLDLGTSALKGIVVNSQGALLRQATAPYPVLYPQNGWTEQNPSDWIVALHKVLAQLVEGIEKDVKGICFGGQMHGLVALDDKDNVIRPCILWNDGRTEKQTKYLNETVGKDFLVRHTGNIAFAGFTAPKLLWLWENEPTNFNKISKIMLPKDYLVYYLSGAFTTDYSDASGTLLLDVANRCWSREMCDICHVTLEQLPTLHESYDVVGTLKKEIASQFGLCSEVKIVAGAGDNAASAIGTGTVGSEVCNISLGTSGTLFVSTQKFANPSNNALHAFCHADGNYHYMGCILSAASANKWWTEDVLRADYELPTDVEKTLGKNTVYFAPYLSGERCPHNDTAVRGAFLGLSANTSKEQMSLAVLEGVAFAFRDCLELIRANGLNVTCSTLCGGGAKSKLWRKVLSNVLNVSLQTVTEQGVSYGAAILALVACGQYTSVEQAVKATVVKQTVESPSPQLVEAYNERYQKYTKLYPLLKEFYC